LIVGDDDVHAFYKSLLEKHGDKIHKDAAKKLAQIVADGAPTSADTTWDS
jgi:hypothetical protein